MKSKLASKLKFLFLCPLFIAAKSYAAPKIIVVAHPVLKTLVAEFETANLQIVNLSGFSGDSHDFDPQPSSLKLLSQADLLMINGLGMEPWFEKINRTLKISKKTSILSDGIPLKIPGDPHAWLNLKNLVVYINNISKALVLLSSTDQPAILATQERLIKEIQALSILQNQKIAKSNGKKSTLVVNHEGVEYFLFDTGVQFFKLHQPNSHQPKTSQLIELQSKAKDNQYVYIQIDPSLDQRVSNSLKEIGVSAGGTYFVDSIPLQGGKPARFNELLRMNLEVIASALKAN